MKGMKGKFLRKLKLISTISNLKQGLVLQLNPTDIFCTQKPPTPPIFDDQDHNLAELEVDNFIGSEDDNRFKEEEMELEFSLINKYKVPPTIISNDTDLAEEKPPPPNMLDTKIEQNGNPETIEIRNYPSLYDFKEICPPGGSQSVILYTTSLRGIRKTFQDCNTVRFFLGSFKVLFYERDISLHSEFRDELWRILGSKVIPPKLFIKGRYIGGADEVVGLHEMGWLKKLMEGIPVEFDDQPCQGCADMRFVICFNCSGSCKVFTSNGKNDEELCIRCSECNENGLVKCPICC